MIPGVTLSSPCLQDNIDFKIIPRLARSTMHYYAAIDGFSIPDDGVVVEPIPDDVTQIVLASDGYPFLRQSLTESEQCLADLLQRDPLLFRDYKSTKGLVAGNASFDDRAYVKIRLDQIAGGRLGSSHQI